MASNLRVFLCHASDDKAQFVRQLAADLVAAGIPVWFDEWSMKAGDSLRRRIFEEGITDCTHFLVVLSLRSVTSRWVQEELDAAMTAHIEGSCELLPLVYGRLRHDRIPLGLRSKVYLRFPSARGAAYSRPLERLLADLGTKEVEYCFSGGPDLAVSATGLTPFASITETEEERLKEIVFNTRIQVGLAGLVLKASPLATGVIHSHSTVGLPTPDLLLDGHGGSISLTAEHAQQVAGLVGDPVRVDPLRIGKISVSNYGRGPMATYYSLLRLETAISSGPAQDATLALLLGSVLIETHIDGSQRVSAAGFEVPKGTEDVRELVAELMGEAVKRLRQNNYYWPFTYQRAWEGRSYSREKDCAIVWDAKSRSLLFVENDGRNWTLVGAHEVSLESTGQST